MILGLEDSVMLDKKIIKVIDGIAGCAKSSSLHSFLKGNYGRYTSTNRLKNDAIARYGGHADTIAGGLFRTVGRHFYAEPKEPEFSTVVIDEVLQSDPAVFDWCSENVGRCNIIICTDSRQLLSPMSEQDMRDAYAAFKLRNDVVLSEIHRSLRPRTSETAAAYEDAYEHVLSDKEIFSLKRCRTGILPEEYDKDAVYIVHTNALEHMLYDMYDMYSRYDAELIPKGTIARKPPKDKELYPILPQDAASDRAGYWQAANIATPQRYQGSEVEQGRRGYFVIEPGSKIGNREWYTVISRFWDLDDLIVCVEQPEREEEIKEYNGVKVKEWYIKDVPPDTHINSGTIGDLVDRTPVKQMPEISRDDMNRITRLFESGDDFEPRRDRVRVNGRTVRIAYDRTGNAKTMHSLITREGVFTYDKIRRVYRAIEGKTEGIRGPMFRNTTSKAIYRYALDLKAAYPHVFNNAVLPTSTEWSEHPFEGGLDWYVCTGGRAYKGAVYSAVCSEYLEGEYIGTSSAQLGSKMGSWLHEQAHRSIEAKDKIKGIHYGYAERQFIEPLVSRDGKITAYCRNIDNTHALLMAGVKSELFRVMSNLKALAYGDPKGGYVNVDCLYFDWSGDIEDFGRLAESAIPGYDFRITENKPDGKELYKTYAYLPTESERRKIMKRKK